MKLRALRRQEFRTRLAKAEPRLREALLDAASEALAREVLAQTGVPLASSPHDARRVVGTSNPADASREFGTLDHPPSPWLAPVLPLALEPMRAAANAAAARALSQLATRKK